MAFVNGLCVCVRGEVVCTCTCVCVRGEVVCTCTLYVHVCVCLRNRALMLLHVLLVIVTPYTRCRLKLLKMERIKDFLMMEEELIQNQGRLKPQEQRNEVCAVVQCSLSGCVHVLWSVWSLILFFLRGAGVCSLWM